MQILAVVAQLSVVLMVLLSMLYKGTLLEQILPSLELKSKV
jgi:hypothetical protein